MLSLSDNQADVTEAFNSTSMTTIQFNKANSLTAEAPFLYLDMYINNGNVSSEIYDKRYAFNFEIVNFTFVAYSFCKSLYKSYQLQQIYDY